MLRHLTPKQKEQIKIIFQHDPHASVVDLAQKYDMAKSSMFRMKRLVLGDVPNRRGPKLSKEKRAEIKQIFRDMPATNTRDMTQNLGI